MNEDKLKGLGATSEEKAKESVKEQHSTVVKSFVQEKSKEFARTDKNGAGLARSKAENSTDSLGVKKIDTKEEKKDSKGNNKKASFNDSTEKGANQKNERKKSGNNSERKSDKIKGKKETKESNVGETTSENKTDSGKRRNQEKNKESVKKKQKKSQVDKVKEKAKQKNTELVRFVGEQSKNTALSESGLDETMVNDVRQGINNVRATKDGVKGSVHVIDKNAKTVKKATVKSYRTFKNRKALYSQAKNRLVRVTQSIKNFFANPLVAIKGAGLTTVILLFLSLVMILTISIVSVVSSFTIKGEEKELSAIWSHITELDSDTTLSIHKGNKDLEINGASSNRENVEIYTNIDPILAYLDQTHGDINLNKTLPGKDKTGKEEIDEIYSKMVHRESSKDRETVTVKDLYEVVKKTDDLNEQLEAMDQVGQYTGLQELRSPFEDTDEKLVVNRRYGYYLQNNSKKNNKGIIVQAKKNQTLYAPMSGTVKVKNNEIQIVQKKKTLILKNVSTDLETGTEIKRGAAFGKTVGENNLYIEYKKKRNNVNPGFYFPNVQYLSYSNFGYTNSGSGYDEAVFRFVISNQCNAFSNKADKIIYEAEKAGVSPVIFAAIMIHESAWGTSDAIVYHNNPSGLMSSSGLMHFDTLDEGIEVTGNTLHNLIVERKLDTVEKLGSVYCPVGAANDPTGLNVNWVPTIKQMMVTLGGSEDMSLLWSDSSSGGGNIGSTKGWRNPVQSDYEVTQNWDQIGYGTGTMHGGIDLASVPKGSQPAVYAAKDGTVMVATSDYIGGNYIMIDHGDGYYTYYGHFSSMSVQQGMKVTNGTVIGIMGQTGLATGVHLHFEVRKGGSTSNFRVDPRSVINFK